MKMVYPDQHQGPVYEYRRANGRPDFPSAATLVLDIIPLPTPQERPEVFLAELLDEDVASRFDFVFIRTLASAGEIAGHLRDVHHTTFWDTRTASPKEHPA